jgi:hypothetical protein
MNLSRENAMACDSNGICINPPSVSCIPPLLFRTNRCECLDGSMPIGFSGDMAICPAPVAPVVTATCVVTIGYNPADPLQSSYRLRNAMPRESS